MGDLQSRPRPFPQPLSPADQYYDRQKRVSGWGETGQAKLAAASVLVVGAGGLGCPLLTALAGSGIGRLVLVDDDRVSLSNLPRQTLYQPGDVGRLKVEVAAEVLRARNPWIKIETLARRLDASNVRALVEDCQIAVDGTDNFTAKFLLHDACRAAGKTFVLASLYQWEAQLQLFDFARSAAGCLRCLYPQGLEDGCVGTCAELGVAGALASAAGNLQALVVLQTLLGVEGLNHGDTWLIDARSWQTSRLKLKARPDCTCCKTAPANWDFLAPAAIPAAGLSEKTWVELRPAERQVVVDVREPGEIKPGEWEWFQAAGCQVIHHPLGLWSEEQPAWQDGTGYLVVCARGIRSLKAIELVPPGTGARFLSLKGGIKLLNIVP